MRRKAAQDNERILALVESYGGGYVWEPEFFGVILIDVGIADAEAAKLCGLTGVQQIAIDASRLSFATLQKIASIPRLKSLVLKGITLSRKQRALLAGCGPKVEFAKK
jgi:hypothetical protein